jgi:phosphoribosyl 1,2-cyclic phosphodiesterase
MVITFWGVRGSIACPGPETARYGGNTACVSVSDGDDTIVLDAGTGIRNLGASLVGSDGPVYLLLSHPHLDHLQGFPYFAPLYQEGRPVYLITPEVNSRQWSPLEMIDGFHFPRVLSDVHSGYKEVQGCPTGLFESRGWGVRCLAVNHPGGAYGFRIERDGAVFVHIPDNELFPPHEPTASFDDVVEFCGGADVLSHDSMYLERDLPQKEGWGHSLVANVCDLAVRARVSRLVLFHHDPDRTDEAVDRIQEEARERLRPHGIDCDAAFDGLEVRL